MGIEVSEDWIFTAPAAAREVLLQRGLKRCHVLLQASLLADLEGIESVEESPEAVLVGDIGEGFSYDRLNRVFRFLLDQDCAFLTLAGTASSSPMRD